MKFDEFQQLAGPVVYFSATPAEYEIRQSGGITAEQLIRPTGLVDPPIEIQPTEGQIDHLIGEINKMVAAGKRTLITTLTKKMSENLTDYLKNVGIKVQYLHSDVDTLERLQIIRDLRLGVFDVLVGINLLREGLDLPEVALVAILDADRQGFLRTETSLIQTVGRAARNLDGRVIMYADTISPAMKKTIEETGRRRKIQTDYNKANHISPKSIEKAIRDIVEATKPVDDTEQYKGRHPLELTKKELHDYVKALEKEMKQAAADLQFERAALLRDQVFEYKARL